jgi:glutamate-5-semialdehyde dehydrogenase
MDNATAHLDLAAVLPQANAHNSKLATTNSIERSRAIKSMATALKSSFQDILQANTLDLEISREARVPDLLVDWLKLTPERLQHQIDMLDRLSRSAVVYTPPESKENLPNTHSYNHVKPLGTIAWLFESLPELKILAAAMTIATGNTAIMFGGTESWQSDLAVMEGIQQGLAASELPREAIQILRPTAANRSSLVTHDRQIALGIVHGRPLLVDGVTMEATVPMLRSSMGNAYLYWGRGADLDLVRHAICDSHQGEPEAINAIEKVLVYADRQASSLTSLWKSLQERGFKLRGDRELVEKYGEYLSLAEEGEWRQPYLRKIIAFKSVEHVEEAIATIDSYSSRRCDCIITDSHLESRQFLNRVKSAYMYVNTSPRFYRENPGTGNVGIGISSARGAIGLDSLVRHQRAIVG